MNKITVNNFLRNFGVELHGLGYLKKISNNSLNKNVFDKQKSLLKTKHVKTIFDVGANRGDITKKYSDLFSEAIIHSFEPIPELAIEYKNRHGKNPLVIFNEMALSGSTGKTSFNINKSLDTSSILNSATIDANSDANCETIKKIEIFTITLNEYCRMKNIEQIDILKLDVQGSELNILQGSTNLLDQKKIKIIYCEGYFKEQYEKQPLIYDIANFLKKYNYYLEDIYDPYYNSNNILWADFIFI
jgi:FkbM family methyltransferase